MKSKKIIEIHPNGDPFGNGFVGSVTNDGERWFYMGNIGSQSRRYWRVYAKKNGYVLRYG